MGVPGTSGVGVGPEKAGRILDALDRKCPGQLAAIQQTDLPDVIFPVFSRVKEKLQNAQKGTFIEPDDADFIDDLRSLMALKGEHLENGPTKVFLDKLCDVISSELDGALAQMFGVRVGCRGGETAWRD